MYREKNREKYREENRKREREWSYIVSRICRWRGSERRYI